MAWNVSYPSMTAAEERAWWGEPVDEDYYKSDFELMLEEEARRLESEEDYD